MITIRVGHVLMSHSVSAKHLKNFRWAQGLLCKRPSYLRHKWTSKSMRFRLMLYGAAATRCPVSHCYLYCIQRLNVSSFPHTYSGGASSLDWFAAWSYFVRVSWIIHLMEKSWSLIGWNWSNSVLKPLADSDWTLASRRYLIFFEIFTRAVLLFVFRVVFSVPTRMQLQFNSFQSCYKLTCFLLYFQKCVERCERWFNHESGWTY